MGDLFNIGNDSKVKGLQKDCLFCRYSAKSPRHLISKNQHAFSVVYGMSDKGLVLSKGQTLVISKEHRENFSELSKEEWKSCFPLIKDAIRRISKVYSPIGFDVFSSLNKEGGQSHFHSHIHIIPKYKKDYGYCRRKWDLSLTSQEHKELEEKLQTKQSIIKENSKAVAKLVPFGNQVAKGHIIIEPKKFVSNNIEQVDEETWTEMWELMKESVKRCKEKLGAKGFWWHTPLGKMTDANQTTRSKFQIDIIPRWNVPTYEERHGGKVKTIPENERIAEKLNSVNNIDSLYELIKKTSQEKGRPLKIICDWDECIQPINPLIWYRLAKQKGWELEKESFEEWFDYYWENSQIEYEQNVPWTKNTTIKEVEEIRNDEKKMKEQIWEPLFKIMDGQDHYEAAPFLSFATEIIKSLKEGLVSKLVIVSASAQTSNSRKRRKYNEIFGKFNNVELELEEPREKRKKQRWELIRDSYPDFDMLVDDSPIVINKVREKFPEDKIFVLPNYKPLRFYIQDEENIFLIENKISELRGEEFAAADLEKRTLRERERAYENNRLFIEV